MGTALLLGAVSCADKAKVDCTVATAPESDVVVKILNINRYEVLDTVKTNAAGHFTYKVDVKPQQPEFVYLFYNDTKIASLLLQKGEKAVVNADTLGAYTVSGSPESSKLQEVEYDYAIFLTRMILLSNRLNAAEPGSEEARNARKEFNKEYVDYYRGRLKYILSNPYSLTNVPVFFQTVGDAPLFSQETDGIYFNNICDSLETVYPDSRYVKALRQEAGRRLNTLEITKKLEMADEVDYLDITMPDVNGVKKQLSSLESRVVLIHFWSATDATHKMLNLEVLKPVYADYKDRGLEIYQVALDTDKASWARVVKEQGLEWINVCDGLGTASPVVSSYNLSSVPASFLLVDGSLSSIKFTDEVTLRRELNKVLK